MALKAQAEGLDKASKIKVALSAVALLVAGVVLVTYVFDISLFGGGAPAAEETVITPEVKEERTRQIQEQKKQEEIQTKNPNTKTSGA
ncbi:MAG: hypothetical protein AB7K52_09395 [Phycisphaerales bacterium]